MHRFIIFAITLAATLAAGTMIAEDSGTAPSTLVFEAKTGPVTFDHARHAERVEGDCEVCHTALWPAERGELGYKPSMHKKAEAEKSSCGACHRPEGSAFESKGNCKRCHVKE